MKTAGGPHDMTTNLFLTGVAAFAMLVPLYFILK
ncbi:hypothetical protein X742_01665 [Mesorhizobium sp. LNHC232B00]|nr:hypothetical protein X742_01665 [Mesorhizobium sp. LNHC232B00]